MKLKPDSKHALNAGTGLHRVPDTHKLLSRAQRGKLSQTEATALVTGSSGITADTLAKAVTRKAKRELK